MILVILLLLFSNPILCWKARAFIAYVGSTSEAEKLALAHGYTKSQISEVRKRCGL